MTDNQDSKIGDAAQPPTDRPLTAGDVLWMVHILGPDDVIPAPDHRSAVDQCADINRAMTDMDGSVLCVAVPALWTGSKGAHEEGLKSIVETWDTRAHTAPGVVLSATDRACYEYPDAHDGPLRSAYVAGAEAYSAAQQMDSGLETWLNARDLMPRGPWDWPSIIAMLDHHEAALASPPVSERERELEGALRVIANASRRSETMFGGKMSDVTRVFVNITRVAESAITAQPAGEGK